MRPKRLELEGFGSFRARTVIDFDAAELFVLSGPTGSGKSTIIDGIAFALYGAVPRYERSNLLRPAISNGKEEARVCLDFEVGGDVFTAIRIVRRTTSGGATTREARLVRGDDVIAGNADEVSAEVQKLLGLTFDHFQKCVVLPQGAFARLLHDGQANRLALLRSLLDIELYSRMRVLASGRAEHAKHEWDVLEGRLANELAGATDDALVTATERGAQLQTLVHELRSDEAQIQQLTERIRLAVDDVRRERESAAPLAVIAMPEGLDQLDAALAGANETLARCEAQAAETESAFEASRVARAQLPERDTMERLLRMHDEAEAARKLLGQSTQQREESAAALDLAVRELERLDIVLAEARARRDATLRDNHAFAAARGLKAGDRCPVCGEILREVPNLEPPQQFQGADDAFQSAQRGQADAARAEQQHRGRVASCEQEVERAQRRVTDLEAAVATGPSRAEATASLGAVKEADQALDTAQRGWSVAQTALRSARAEIGVVRERSDDIVRALDRARDSVAPLGPPQVDRTEPVGAWRALVAWASDEAEKRGAHLEALEHQAHSLAAERDGFVAAQVRRCEAGGLAPGPTPPIESATTACARAEDTVSTITAQLATARDLRIAQETLAGDERVSAQLARHLRADRFGFETWYVRQVVEHLTYSASETLMALSQGQFSLALDNNDEFEVVDHANAGTRRHIRTLSGGETFLASLSLALALADSIATVAAGSTARLDAILLDEGFGTLDPETLDVVATAIEELAAGGRMVGIVTHVAELAARMPVRYEVRRGPGGSTVQRIEA